MDFFLFLARAARRRRGIALLLICWSADAAPAPAPNASAISSGVPPIVRSLAALASSRAGACERPHAATPAAWRETTTQCAWRGRLALRRWRADGAAPQSCVSAQALWWHWLGATARGGAALPVWNAAWHRQASAPQIDEADGARSVSLLSRTGDGAWSATEWRWTPPARAATRAWEQRRWEQLLLALRDLGDAVAEAGPPPALLELGRRNLRGRPAERVDGELVWQADQQCLHLQAADRPDDPAMPLPYARQDSRLEQRAATQVQLARSTPGASWPMAFHLLPPSTPRQRGAAYAAILRRDDRLTGRLWLPGRTGQSLLRARLETSLAALPGSPGAARAVATIEREMAALAALWSSEHER